jgi:hypothetical protein
VRVLIVAHPATEQRLIDTNARHEHAEEGHMFTSVSPHPVTPAKGLERSGLARLWHQLGPGSRKRHARARVESQWLAALRYQWQQACQHVGLGLMIYTPSGVTVSVPRIVRADFGPPVSFTVRLRPGQGAADLTAAVPRLARALGVAGLRVTEREAGWVNVVVVGPGSCLGDGDGDSVFQRSSTHNRPDTPELRIA